MFSLVVTFGANYHDSPRVIYADVQILEFEIPKEFSIDDINEDGVFPRLPEYILDKYTYHDHRCTFIPILAEIQRTTTIKCDIKKFIDTNGGCL